MFPTLLLKSVGRYLKYIHRAITGFLATFFHVSILQSSVASFSLCARICCWIHLPSSIESVSLREIVDLSTLLQISSLICFHLRNTFLNLFWIVIPCLFLAVVVGL